MAIHSTGKEWEESLVRTGTMTQEEVTVRYQAVGTGTTDSTTSTSEDKHIHYDAERTRTADH